VHFFRLICREKEWKDIFDDSELTMKLISWELVDTYRCLKAGNGTGAGTPSTYKHLLKMANLLQPKEVLPYKPFCVLTMGEAPMINACPKLLSRTKSSRSIRTVRVRKRYLNLRSQRTWPNSSTCSVVESRVDMSHNALTCYKRAHSFSHSSISTTK